MNIFEDVRQTELTITRAHKARVDHLERAINLGKKLLGLKGAPGYSDFEKALQSLYNATLRVTMEGDSISTRKLWEARGSLRTLSRIISMMSDTERNLEGLAEQLRQEQALFASKQTKSGKLKPESLVR